MKYKIYLIMASSCNDKLFDLLNQVQALASDIQNAYKQPNPNNINLDGVFETAEKLSTRVL
jgi:hypothetical protein